MKKNSVSKRGKTHNKDFPVVGIGASAGGIEAIMALLKNLPANTGMAYVYIQHLSPEKESLLPSLLSKITKMKVLEAKNNMPVMPNHFYVIPPDKDIISVNRVLKLSKRNSHYFPIDQFFLSLAEKHEGAIGVILSGSANDGTKGLKAIRMAGGITIAQNKTAKFSSMPQSAIAEGVVDFVLSPKDIAGELVRISTQPDVHNPSIENNTIDNINDELNENDSDFKAILTLLHKNKEVDFSNYKMNTIKRRVLRRMLLFRQNKLNDYLKILKKDPTEINLLYNDLLINVTYFFREPETYKFIQKTLLPKIIKSKSKGETLRVWIAACSSGEEAYSFAIMILEILAQNASNMPVQIFATDLNEEAIAKARIGEYSEYDLRSLSPKQVQRFFAKSDGTYRISKQLREMCIFAPHNIFRDPPFSRIDFISCCNLFIYLDPTLQRKALTTFHYSLNDDGYLMLGKSETIGSSTNLFSPLNSKYKIYTRKKEKGLRTLPSYNFKFPASISKENNSNPKKRNESIVVDLDRSIDSILLSNYIPASVVVNSRMEILQFRGNTAPFLHHLSGKASLNILKMVLPDLSFELRSALLKAIKSKHKIKKSGIQLSTGHSSRNISIEILPLNIEWEESLYLVLFYEDMVLNEPVHPGKITTGTVSERKIKKLEGELNSAREEMRSYIEDQETANEELQSASEEIVSSNEELQSINEELETSKEEIESTNEELITTNQELQMRNEQLAESYAYTQSIIATLHEPIIILDKELRIKSANKSFYKKFKQREDETEGFSLFEIAGRNWDIPKLRDLLEDVIPKNNYIRNYELVHEFRQFGKKTLLINVEKIVQKNQREQLILLAIEDITAQKDMIEKEKDIWFKNIANSAPVMIWVAGTNRMRTFFNHTWLEYTGKSLSQESGNGWMENIHPDDYERCISTYLQYFKKQKSYTIEYRLKKYDGVYKWMSENGKPYFDLNGEFIGYLGSCVDIEDQKLVRDELEEKVSRRTNDLNVANMNLERSNNELQQFAYVASHDLQEPLRKILTFSSRISQKLTSIKSPEVENYLDKVIDAAQRMSRLINDLLNFSRSLRLEIQFEKVNLNKILREVLDDFEVLIKERKTIISIDNFPVIEAIPLQMQQLFHNLISNSFKFFQEGKKPRINITCKELSEKEVPQNITVKSKKYLEIIVKDNGIGFEQEFAEKIFVIFQRLHDRQKYTGTGIGLALCKRIVANHGGIISAESEQGKGAAFRIILPVSQKRQ